MHQTEDGTTDVPATTSADPWNGVVAALGGDASPLPSAGWPAPQRHRLMVPQGIDGGRQPTAFERRILDLVAVRPYSAAELAVAADVGIRELCNRLARMRLRGFVERTARGWQPVDLSARPAAAEGVAAAAQDGRDEAESKR